MQENMMTAQAPEPSAQERAGKAFPVSWDQFHRDCRALTWRLNEVGPFKAVIAITRGGLVPAVIVADLVDTGKTARLVRDMLPRAHFATVYAKPKGRPMVDTFITEVSQDTWIFFPWDTALSFAPPLRDGAA